MVRRYSISTYLITAMLAIVAPFCLFLWFLAWQLQASEAEAVDRRTLRSAQSISRAIEPVIDSMVTTVNLLSSTEELAKGEFEIFHRRSQFALSNTGQYVILVDADQNQILNTRVEYGTPLGKISDTEGFERALQLGKPVATDFFLGKTSGKWVFNVLKPLDISQSSKARVLLTTMNMEHVAATISDLELRDGWKAIIVDGSGNALDASGMTPEIRPSTDVLPTGMESSDLSQMPSISHLETTHRQILAYARIGGTNWKAVVWGPLASAQASILKTWQLLIVGTIALLGVCILVVYAASKLLQREVSNITRMADELGAGQLVSPATSRIREFDFIARALSNASYDRSNKEEQLTMVMRELAHRTKNLISIVLAMVRQSAKNVDSPQELVAVTGNRIAGLGQSIDLLTSANWKTVTLNSLIESQLSKFGTVGSDIMTSGPEFHLGSDAVQNLGMAFHELATNASKYGALKGEAGRIEISWEILHDEAGDQLRIIWRETGGPEVLPPEKTSFGTEILERHLSASTNGQTTLEYHRDGVVWTLTAPVSTLNRSTPG